MVVALLAGIASGALIGLLNGYLVGIQKLDHFVTTFATMSLAKGLALVICDGDIINTGNNDFKAIGASTSVFLGLHVHIWIVAVIFAVMLFVLTKTKFGYRIYSIGGSEQAAMLAYQHAGHVYPVVSDLRHYGICGRHTAGQQSQQRQRDDRQRF